MMMRIPVSDIMTTNVISVPATLPVKEVAALLNAHRITGVPVTDAQGRVVGVLSEFDIIARHGVTAAEIMSADVISVTADTDVSEVAQLLTDRRIRRVPVLKDGSLVGIVSRSDLLRLFMTTRWRCQQCGYFERGFDRPVQCAACGSEQLVLEREPGVVPGQETGFA